MPYKVTSQTQKIHVQPPPPHTHTYTLFGLHHCQLIIELRLWGPGSQCLLCSLKIFSFRHHHVGRTTLGYRLDAHAVLTASVSVSLCFQTRGRPDCNTLCSGNYCLESKLNHTLTAANLPTMMANMLNDVVSFIL